MSDVEQGRTGTTARPQGEPAAGNWRQRLRLASGLVLLAFCMTHFTNHALGIVSVNAMNEMSLWHYEIWSNDFGQIVLAAAALTHVSLALWRTAKRSTLKMPFWEFTQLVLGLYIPWTLIPHVTATMGLMNAHGVIPTYKQMLTMLWPDGAITQSVLLIVVWSHAMIGLHFWLRLRPLYRRLLPVLTALAVAFPLLALWGWISAARRLAAEGTYKLKVTDAQIDWVYSATDQFRAIVFGLIILSFAVVLFRMISRQFGKRITIRYPGDLKVRATPGPSLLEMSRMNGIPHTAICGGRARCSTCRVLVLEGQEDLPPPSNAEEAVLARIDASESVRLACQVRPSADMLIRPLVPAKSSSEGLQQVLADAYHWGVEQEVVIMFVDLRNFTKITETNLHYDVVFLLNRYLDTVSAAIRAEGGQVDKFIGDGVMAIFGMKSGLAEGARQALRAAARLGQVLEDLNKERGPQFRDPLRIGIGLHAGPAILGRIGEAGATGSQAPITALGDVVNTASRLETENKAHGSLLIVSQSVLDAAGQELADLPTAEVSLRGKENLLKVHIVHDLNALLTAA